MTSSSKRPLPSAAIPAGEPVVPTTEGNGRELRAIGTIGIVNLDRWTYVGPLGFTTLEVDVVAITESTGIEITIAGACDQQAVNNVVHFRWQEVGLITPPVPTVGEFLTSFRGLWRAAILPRLGNSYTVSRYVLKTFTNLLAPAPPTFPNKRVGYTDLVDLPGVAGTDVGGVITDTLPTYANATVQKRTGLAGRSFRGSIRYAPIPEDTTLLNELTTAAQSAWGIATVGIGVVTIGVNTWLMGIFQKQRFLTQAPGPYDMRAFIPLINAFTPNKVLGSQVSRKRKGLTTAQ